MKVLAGIMVGVVGVATSVYVGVVVFFVGGIEMIINGANAHPTNGHKIAWGILQILVADSVAGLLAFVSIILGYFIATGESYRQRRRRLRSRPRPYRSTRF